jgi:membrane associated rhomboid family serine protease
MVAVYSFMFGVTTSDDYRPVAWMGRYPVDVTTILVITHVATMVAGCLLIAFGGTAFFAWLQFDSDAVLHGFAWHQLVTYAFVHAPSSLLWFAIEMYMLFIFGREVERFLGRKAFIALYCILLIGPTVLLSLWGLKQRTALAGSSDLHMGLFIAFATIYPRVELMFRILAKWAAVVFVAAFTLQLMAFHIWWELAVLWFSVGAAFLFVELRGAGPDLRWLAKIRTFIGPKPRLHIVQKSAARRVVESDDVYASVDPILDKISKSGIGSLTDSERRQLDRARKRLLKESQ